MRGRGLLASMTISPGPGVGISAGPRLKASPLAGNQAAMFAILNGIEFERNLYGSLLFSQEVFF